MLDCVLPAMLGLLYYSNLHSKNLNLFNKIKFAPLELVVCHMCQVKQV